MVGSVIHKHTVGSVIQDYSNLEATLSTPQDGFKKKTQAIQRIGVRGNNKGIGQEPHW